MTTFVANQFFPIYSPKSGRVSRNAKQGGVEQVLPSTEKILEYRESSYLLDSISEIISDATRRQSLSQEQLLESKVRALKENLSTVVKKYQISKVREVENFILQNSHLVPLLEEIPERINEFFGDEKLSLELISDPDFPQSTELWVLVLTQLQAKEARPLMDKFDEKWWLQNLFKTDDKLNIGLEYV